MIMGKNLFEVSEEERKKIIELHINATKKQYLTEFNQTSKWETTSEDAKKIIEMLMLRKSAEIKIESNNGCYSTLWIDNFAGENLEVVACAGGWLQIRETQTYKGITGKWSFLKDFSQKPTAEWGKIEFLGQTFQDKYSPSTTTQTGILMNQVFCKFMTSSEVCSWEFWEDWSWNSDSLYGEALNKCNKDSLNKCWNPKKNPNISSGFWDSLLDLLPGGW